jgi:hypothetical protein
MTWHEHAACLPHPTEWWWPDTDAHAKKAKKICAACPVQDDCRQDAIDQGDQHTIRAGVNLAITDFSGVNRRSLPPHGTRRRYNHGCRCEPCREASAAYARQLRERHKGVPFDQIPHGTRTGRVNYCCGCDACRAAENAYNQQRKAVTA